MKLKNSSYSMPGILFGLLLLSLLVTVACSPAALWVSPNTSNRYLAVKETLKAGDWKTGNYDLLEIALDVTGRSAEGRFDVESIQNFPCADMLYIDQIARAYSDNKFGLTAQQEIYATLKATLPNASGEDLFIQFAEQVGWRKNGEWIPYSQLDFSVNAPKGQFLVNVPRDTLRSPFKSRSGTPDQAHNFAMVLERLTACKPQSPEEANQ